MIFIIQYEHLFLNWEVIDKGALQVFASDYTWTYVSIYLEPLWRSIFASLYVSDKNVFINCILLCVAISMLCNPPNHCDICNLIITRDILSIHSYFIFLFPCIRDWICQSKNVDALLILCSKLSLHFHCCFFTVSLSHWLLNQNIILLLVHSSFLTKHGCCY